MRPRTFSPLLAALAVHFATLLLPASAYPQAAAALKYQVDARGSRVYVRVDPATRLGHAHGIVGLLTSGIIVPDGPSELVFDLTSFQADTPEARQTVGLDPKASRSDARKVTTNMLGPDVLDATRYPRAAFTIAAFAPLDGQAVGTVGRYQVDGRFNLHGVARPLRFTATLERAESPGKLRLRGAFALLQTDYGIQPYSALGGLVRVANALQIWGDVLLTP